jgi:hypothetical protein
LVEHLQDRPEFDPAFGQEHHQVINQISSLLGNSLRRPASSVIRRRQKDLNSLFHHFSARGFDPALQE